jgi:hypothetical protein
MPHSLTPGKTSGLAALAIALALLLTSFSASADAALSHAQQASRAAGQAAFFCYAWNCSSRTRITAAYSGSTLRTTWRLTNPHHMFGHGNCTRVANMSINVTSSGSITSRLLSCR